MDYALKAMDSVTNANYEQKDLSNLITRQDGPPRPFLQTIGIAQAKGKTHYWDEVPLNQVGRGLSSYAEGGKPGSQTNPPVQLSNIVCRVGQVAKVTDTEAAIWTAGGTRRLADGELERLIQEAIDLDTELKMEEQLNEMEWMLLNGNKTNTEAWAGGQCDGVVQVLTTNNILADGGSGAAMPVTRANAVNFEPVVMQLAANIRATYAPAVPDLFLCTTATKGCVNGFIGGGAGRPIVQLVNADSAGFVAGQEVDEYQTGYFKVRVVQEPQIEIAALGGKATPPTTARALMLSTKRFKRADLIPLRSEPLARINTSVERMITWEGTLEFRNQKESGQIRNLVA